MNKKIPLLPMMAFRFRRSSRAKLKSSVLLCFLSLMLCAQSDEGMVMTTCGYAFGNADQHTIVAYQLQSDGELASIYSENLTFDKLGSVYGLAMDNNGNYYIAAGGLYGAASNMNFRTHGNNTSPTMIYKIDGATIENGKDWAIKNLVVAGDFESGENTIPNPAMCGARRAGLGNITYNARHNFLYTTNLSDGKIYQLDTDGKLLQAFDPAFDGKSYKVHYGYAALGQRPLALAIKYPQKGQEDKLLLYYSRWTEDANNTNHTANNEIWAVELDAQTGSFIPSTEHKIKTIASPKGIPSTPITDIEFDAESMQMLLTERSLKSYSSYLALEALPGDAFEMKFEEKDWKRVAKTEGNSNHLTYGLSEKTPKRFAPDQLTIIDLGSEPDEEKAIIGDIDFSQLRKQATTEMAEIAIYPNPTSGLVQIEGALENASYILLSNNGQILKQGTLTAQSNVIDLSAMSNGTYMLSIISEDKVLNKKINKIK